MAKNTYYKQATMSRKAEESSTTQVSWIPEKWAKVDQVLKLKGDDDLWVDGWVVESVGETRLPENQLPDYRKMIRGHRKSTGDSQKKER